jgi:tetratricopeptide (TPR) repeat protein
MSTQEIMRFFQTQPRADNHPSKSNVVPIPVKGLHSHRGAHRGQVKVEEMQSLNAQPSLTAEERSQKRKLVVRDTVALLTLLAVTLVLLTATVFLFRSFSDLRERLSQRWLERGEAALHSGNPARAVEDLRSALAYAPGQRSIEIDLAEALAGAGRTQEATSYFTTLWEAEPGSGIINLQLARLAARQGNEAEALERYRASIYGDWEGDGSIRRRAVRLELINYLIDRRRFDPAHGELIIAAGNAPDDPAIKLQIAALMEKARDPGNASQIYKAILQHAPRNLPALEGAARTAFALGNFAQARDYVDKALANPAEASESAQARQDLHDLRDRAVETLLLYPSPALSTLAQAQRVLRDRNLVAERLRGCGVLLPSTAANSWAAVQPVRPQFADVIAKWQALPDATKLTVAGLTKDEELRHSVMNLLYTTEQTAEIFCGPATV